MCKIQRVVISQGPHLRIAYTPDIHCPQALGAREEEVRMLKSVNELSGKKLTTAVSQLLGMRSELDGRSSELVIAHEVRYNLASRMEFMLLQ